jgi:leucyl/phenylalanyl-tRNA---protein transferase
MQVTEKKDILTLDILLKAYSIGLFPMADRGDNSDIYWVNPEKRGIFPLDKLIISHTLAKKMRQNLFQVTLNHAFEQVITACAAPRTQGGDTWINTKIKDLYTRLHKAGHAHSVEVWQAGTLVGGLYGVSLASAFCGESMFHSVTDTSKIALTHLIAQLRIDGFSLLDTQFLTPHLASLGAIEISRNDYRVRLAQALKKPATFAESKIDSSRTALHIALTGSYPDF